VPSLTIGFQIRPLPADQRGGRRNPPFVGVVNARNHHKHRAIFGYRARCVESIAAKREIERLTRHRKAS
jgi:hypothetical protein